jgi:ABC-2 type transport system permease protein
MSSAQAFAVDTWVIARRGIKHIRRQPEALSDATIQPIVFVVLFAYVFGGAISVPGGGSYKEFLMGGIFAQTIVFGCFGVAMALAYDRTNGAIDRFHSLPIARGTFLSGHSVANLIRSTIPIFFMTATGLAIGWRIHSSFTDALGAYVLMFVFSFAVIWVGVMMASLVPTPEAVQGIAFVVIFPITFIASTFVPTSTLPGVLQTFAEWNPTSSLANALRHQFGNPGGEIPHDAIFPLAHPFEYTLIWAVAIVPVCAPLSVVLYRRSIRT